MKKDMQALAQAQFGEANKKYNAMKVLLLQQYGPASTNFNPRTC